MQSSGNDTMMTAFQSITITKTVLRMLKDIGDIQPWNELFTNELFTNTMAWLRYGFLGGDQNKPPPKAFLNKPNNGLMTYDLTCLLLEPMAAYLFHSFLQRAGKDCWAQNPSVWTAEQWWEWNNWKPCNTNVWFFGMMEKQIKQVNENGEAGPGESSSFRWRNFRWCV